MTRLNLEKLAAERRMKKRGTEMVDGSGYFKTTRPEDRKGGARILGFIAMAKAYKPIDEVVEAARHVPLPPEMKPLNGTETRAERDAWTRGILDACED